MLLLNNGFSLFFELQDNLATHITRPSEEDPAELCHPPPPWFFQTQRGHGRIWRSKKPEANVVVTNTIATTSTVNSSHTTLGSVTRIGPQLESWQLSEQCRLLVDWSLAQSIGGIWLAAVSSSCSTRKDP